MALRRARPRQVRDSPTPSVEAHGWYRRDARGDLIGLSPLAESSFLPLLSGRDVFHASPASDHFTLVDLRAPRGIGDFELRLTLTIAPTDNRRAGFVKLARLVLGGAATTEAEDRVEAGLIGHVELEVPSGFSLRNCEPGGDIAFPDPLVIADGKKLNTIRFLRVGDQMEVFIDNRRVLYRPILPDMRLQTIRFQVVGAVGQRL